MDKPKAFYTCQELFIGAVIHVGLPISRMQVEIGEQIVANSDAGKFISIVRSKEHTGFTVEIMEKK